MFQLDSLHSEPTKNRIMYFRFVLLFGSLLTMIILSSFAVLGQATGGSAPLVSTRGNFNLKTGELVQGHNSTDYSSRDIPGLQSGQCPNEIVVLGTWGMGRWKI